MITVQDVIDAPAGSTWRADNRKRGGDITIWVRTRGTGRYDGLVAIHSTSSIKGQRVDIDTVVRNAHVLKDWASGDPVPGTPADGAQA